MKKVYSFLLILMLGISFVQADNSEDDFIRIKILKGKVAIGEKSFTTSSPVLKMRPDTVIKFVSMETDLSVSYGSSSYLLRKLNLDKAMAIDLLELGIDSVPVEEKTPWGKISLLFGSLFFIPYIGFVLLFFRKNFSIKNGIFLYPFITVAQAAFAMFIGGFLPESFWGTIYVYIGLQALLLLGISLMKHNEMTDEQMELLADSRIAAFFLLNRKKLTANELKLIKESSLPSKTKEKVLSRLLNQNRLPQ